jgi:K+-transporting ATPase ATPase C chain
VAQARGEPPARIAAIIDRHAFSPGGPLTPDPLVNVLELNQALDRDLGPVHAATP